jgi:hypothetical protein
MAKRWREISQKNNIRLECWFGDTNVTTLTFFNFQYPNICCVSMMKSNGLILAFFCYFTIELANCGDPPVIQKSVKTSTIAAGQKFKISCVLASGSVPVEFSWFKDNQRIVVGKHVQIKSLDEDNSILTYSSISPNDAGLYKCIAKNSAGSDLNEVQVIVKGNNFCLIIQIVY